MANWRRAPQIRFRQFFGNRRGVADARPGENQHRMPAFQYRNYRLYFAGQIISVIGTWMQATAEAWLVVGILHASALQLSLVSIFQFTPVLLLGIPAGLITDRFSKRNVLLFTQAMYGVLAAIISILIFTDLIQLWHIYAVALTYGINSAVDQPTRQAFVSEMVDKNAILNAVSTNSAVFNTGRVIGPAVAGIVLAAVGPALCFAINATSYIAVLIMLLRMDVKPVITRIKGSALTGLREGLAYVKATPAVMVPILLIGLVGVFGMNFNVWVPLLAKEDFNAGPGTYAALMSSMGVGSFIGAVTLALFGKKPSHRRMLGFAIALGSAELILGYVASIPGPVVAGMISIAIAGFCLSNTSAMANTIVQTTAPDELRGRVMAVYMTLASGSVPIGAFIAGAISTQWSAAVAVGSGGVIAALAALVIALWHRRLQEKGQAAPQMSHLA